MGDASGAFGMSTDAKLNMGLDEISRSRRVEYRGRAPRGGRNQRLVRRARADPYSSRPQKLCDNCGQPGHFASRCHEPAQCHCCGSTEHIKANCDNLLLGCRLCGKVGHLEAKCHARRGTKLCDNCGQPGHLAASCDLEPECHCCGSTAHKKGKCPHSQKKCNRCGKYGHLEAKCHA